MRQYRGKPVIVLFYLGHGCPHCVRQIHDFAAMAGQFTAAGISLVAIGTDAPDSLSKTWESGAPTSAFPLASDSSLEIFKKYHCYDDFEKMPLHGTFLIDAQGLIRWQDISYDPFLDAGFLRREGIEAVAGTVDVRRSSLRARRSQRVFCAPGSGCAPGDSTASCPESIPIPQ